MGALRDELNEGRCRWIEWLLPGRIGAAGRRAEDNQRFVNGVPWVVRSGMRWEDLPERYGKYKSAHKRFARWAQAGVWDRVFDDLVADTKNPYPMPDSTIVRARQQAAKGAKKGSEDKAPGRSEVD